MCPPKRERSKLRDRVEVGDLAASAHSGELGVPPEYGVRGGVPWLRVGMWVFAAWRGGKRVGDSRCRHVLDRFVAGSSIRLCSRVGLRVFSARGCPLPSRCCAMLRLKLRKKTPSGTVARPSPEAKFGCRAAWLGS